MNLIDMSRPKPHVEEVSKPVAVNDSYYEKYPWGLRINLGSEEIAKLGIDLKNFDVDTDGKGSFTFSVVEKSESEMQSSEGGKKINRRLELQIKTLAVAGLNNFDEAFKEAVDEEE